VFVIKDFELYTIEEISEILKVTPRTIYNYIKNKNLKAVKIGKYWRVTDIALKEFIQNGTEKVTNE
jgi:excisionase family DNA binding protein